MSINSDALDTIDVDGLSVGRGRLKKNLQCTNDIYHLCRLKILCNLRQ